MFLGCTRYYMEVSINILSALLLTPMEALGSVFAAAIFAGLNQLFKEFLTEEETPFDPSDTMTDYEKFKDGFWRFISFEMESMGKERFMKNTRWKDLRIICERTSDNLEKISPTVRPGFRPREG